MNDITIISDLHLGSEVCQSKSLLSFLSNLKTRTLILNGDIFDSWNFKRLKKAHWNILSELRHLSKKTQIIWLSGNHDGPADLISHILGIDIYDEYIIETDNNRILILHGDVFDKFIVKHPIVTFCADCIYKVLQKIDASFWIAHKVKTTSKTFLRCTERIRHSAIEYALSKGCNIVICGHTHLVSTYTNYNVTYFNCGCWTELPAHYITINNEIIKIEKYGPVV